MASKLVTHFSALKVRAANWSRVGKRPEIQLPPDDENDTSHHTEEFDRLEAAGYERVARREPTYWDGDWTRDGRSVWFLVVAGIFWTVITVPLVITFVQLFASVDLAWGFRSLEAPDWLVHFLSDEFLAPTRWLLGLFGLQHLLPNPAPPWAIGLAINSYLLTSADFQDIARFRRFGFLGAVKTAGGFLSDLLKYALLAIGTVLGVGPLFWWLSWLLPDANKQGLLKDTLQAYLAIVSTAVIATGLFYGLNALVANTSTGQVFWASVEAFARDLWSSTLQVWNFVSPGLTALLIAGAAVIGLIAVGGIWLLLAGIWRKLYQRRIDKKLTRRNVEVLLRAFVLGTDAQSGQNTQALMARFREEERWLADRAIRSASGDLDQMVRLPAGNFFVSSPNGDENLSMAEQPQHLVRVRAFAIGKYPVTFEEFDAFCAATNYYLRATGENVPNDMGWGRGRRPVVNVSWEDAHAYIDWLNRWSGGGYRLPTEAEWEYACRAGETARWSFGDREQDIHEYAWFNGNADNMSHTVGEKRPNAFGLYDMHGNVWEWCEDLWNKTSQYVLRVRRGGCWSDEPRALQSSSRTYAHPTSRCDDYGFRLARTL